MNKHTATKLFSLLFPLTLAACGADDQGPDGEDFDPGQGIAADAPVGRTVLHTPDGDREVSYDVVGEHALLEGDIDLGPAELLRAPGAAGARSNVNLFGGRWPSTVFVVKPTFKITEIEAAIADLEAKTDVHFMELPVYLPGLNMIAFAPSLDPGVSSSAVGMQGGEQFVRVWATHGQGVIEHELGHAIGLWHEQERLDRDSFVNINWFCMPQSRWHNFDKTGIPVGTYDFKSIMHYSSFSFSSIDGCPVMTKKDGSTFSGNSVLSAGDIAGINLLF
jgi:hypothetical protein